MSLPTLVRERLRKYREPLPLLEFEDYDGYWQERAGEPIIHPRWQLAVERIPTGATVLDVGCGSGGFLAHLRAVRPDVTATGTDISPAAVAQAAAAGFDAFVADLTSDSLDRTFDVVTAFEVIEHIVDAEVVLRKLRDATEDVLIMSLPNFGFLHHRIRLAVFGRVPNTSLMFHAKEHVRHWTVRDFREWAEHHGLRVVDVLGQYGSPRLPWRRFPALLSPQVVYVLQPHGARAPA